MLSRRFGELCEDVLMILKALHFAPIMLSLKVILNMLEITELTQDSEFAALKPEWQTLIAAAEDATPFQTWEWCAAWWKHYATHRSRFSGQIRLFILRARGGGKTVGLMPLVISRYRGTPLRQLRFMGAPLSDYQGPILLGNEAEREACAAAFLAHLARRAHLFDFCDFADLPMGATLTRTAAYGLRLLDVHHRVCPIIALGNTWDEFYRGLGKNMRQNLGRRRRQVARQFAAEFDVVGADAVDETMEALFRLHNARWRKRGVPGAFANPRIQDFHRELSRSFLSRGWLRLYRLRLDGVPRAIFYCFRYGPRVYYYLSGFDLEFAKFSIGSVALSHAIESAIGEGVREFDLLRGDESYKFSWNAVERSTRRLVIGHDELRSRMAVWAHRLERYIEHRGLAMQRRLWGKKREKVGSGSEQEQIAADNPSDRPVQR